jgi:membrane-associated phospholipid phosphatase
MKHRRPKFVLVVCCLLAAETFSLNGYAQPQEEKASTLSLNTAMSDAKKLPPSADEKTWFPQDLHDRAVDNPNAVGMPLIRNLWSDQQAIWRSPGKLHWRDGSWLFPLAAVTGGLFATDQSAVKWWVPSDPNRLHRFRTLSNYGVASLAGVGGGLYLWGKISQDDHRTETGILAGEAAIDALAVSSVLKYSFGRERPYQNDGRGAFFQGGTSFPSDHAAAAWSIASVLAHEYPGPLTKLVAYGAATAVSVSRFKGQQHFPSDVLVGSAIGWLIGREVYRAHHDVELGGAGWSSLAGDEDREDRRDRRRMGSPFVPLDSWVYPAFEKLAALGYVNTAILGLKPWTRIECARLTEEATESLQQREALSQEVDRMQGRLQEEFAYELQLLGGGRNRTANLESVYARAVSISGPALTDSYHFGQTVSYDFGRPFERGTNGQVGGSFSAAAGPMTVYVRAEYQHAPAAPASSDAALNAIALGDGVPRAEVPAGPTNAINRPRLLDAYVAVNLNNWQLVLGRQSLSWTPGPAGSMIWSNNTEPLNMVRLVNAEPFHLPGILRITGPVRVDQFFGRLGGHPYVPKPFIYGQKISVKPFPFLELGFGRTTTIGGTGGDAFTARNFIRSYAGLTDPRTQSVPGNTLSEMDWTFYVPKVRNYIVLYGDSSAPDDILPIENPARNPWHPGLYITRIPKIPKLDFHIEGVSSEQLGTVMNTNNGQFNYWNQTYRDGYTNNGFLIGNAVGRDGRSIQAWFTYWLSPRDTVRLMYRHNTVSSDFLPGGAAWQDYSLRTETYLRSGFYVKGELQYENISRYPLLFDQPQKNFTAILELGFSPREKK